MHKDEPGARHPPAPERLPAPRSRATRRGPERATLDVLIEVVTPIFGGGARARELDELEVVRPATVRGHLRSWWRALHAPRYASSEELYDHESDLWGRAASEDGRGRSAVEVRIDVRCKGGIEHDGRSIDPASAYALWPAREERTKPAAPRRIPGTRFQLTLTAPDDAETMNQLRNTVRAWILFGGYGGRTRRGLGSLGITTIQDRRAWLPAAPTRKGLEQSFGCDIFSPPMPPAARLETPRLAGGALHVGRAIPTPIDAWTTALGWLQEFRQGTTRPPGHRAREPHPSDRRRPSISNWPEADKIRQLAAPARWSHSPRHNATPAWPRASFGLPIIGRFQRHARSGGLLEEPPDFELRWRPRAPAMGARSDQRRSDQRRNDQRRRDGDRPGDRLASPLIVKPMPLADGTFVPCALWLDRAYPDGDVLAYRAGSDDPIRGSAAPFDRLVAPGDVPKLAALAGKATLREAFLDWLAAAHKTTAVAP